MQMHKATPWQLPTVRHTDWNPESIPARPALHPEWRELHVAEADQNRPAIPPHLQETDRGSAQDHGAKPAMCVDPNPAPTPDPDLSAQDKAIPEYQTVPPPSGESDSAT